MNWTTEQIIALSPDAGSTKNGQKLANLQSWLSLGTNDQNQVIWGECKGSGKNPYQTQIDLKEPAFKCSCPSRKFPCKHGLGLFLLYLNHGNSFPQTSPPEWVEQWLVSRATRQEKKITKTTIADPKAQQKRIQERQKKIQAGIEELDLILTELIRQGLVTIQNQSYQFWDRISARMIDAQAPNLAKLIKQISSVIYSGEGWQERLLIKLGQLYLILEGYQKLDSFSPEFQGDLKSLVGWTIDQQELLSNSNYQSLEDQWLVIARKQEEEERLKVQRTWLLGENTQKVALILDFAYGQNPLDVSLVAGTKFQGELIFFPSIYPLRAIIKNRINLPNDGPKIQGYDSIKKAISAYQDALIQLPWLEHYLLVLSQVIPLKYEENWLIYDQNYDSIPLDPNFNQGWQLVAISGGYPFTLFGEWKHNCLKPLTVFSNQQFFFFD